MCICAMPPLTPNGPDTMTWRELWQTTVANLRAIFGGRADAAAYPPPLPAEPTADLGTAPDQDIPSFPTVWDDPTPAPAAPQPKRAEPSPLAVEQPAVAQPEL